MKHINRILLYLAGLFFLAIGVVIAIKSNLGVSPVTSIPLAISKILQISLGTVTTGVFVFYVLIQVAILGKRFKSKSLLQIFFGFVFGFFVDFAADLLKWISVNSYISQLALILLSAFFIAVGIMLLVTMDIVPGAPEGFIMVLCDVTNVPFPKMKVWFDCISVILAAVLSMVFLGNISTIREGTIISALIIGKILGVIVKPCEPWLKKAAFYDRLETLKLVE